MADKYGIIVLGPGSGYWNLVYPKKLADTVAIEQRQHLDVLLKQVFQKFAIDPDNIAILGTCATGLQSTSIGVNNSHVFNRIISLSGPGNSIEPVNLPTPKTVEFFFGGGLGESLVYARSAQELRQNGYRVVEAFGIHGHGHSIEIYDHVGRWLQETWAQPSPETRVLPRVLVDPLPALTSDVLAKMTAFWSRFVNEPDSIRLLARRAHLRPIVVPIGTHRPVVLMTDVAALAAQYPSVAAALKAAGLTAQQHDAYRVALLSARVATHVRAKREVIGSLDSVLAENVVFLNEHPGELQALEDASNGYVRNDSGTFRANMWNMP